MLLAKVLPVTVALPELAMQAPEAPLVAVFPVKTQLLTVSVAGVAFWMPPPGPPLFTELAEKVELFTVSAPSL